jgi:hypothetical protein
LYPQHQMNQMSHEQFYHQPPMNPKVGYGRSSMSRDERHQARKTASSGKTSKAESSRKYEHTMNTQLIHLADYLKCVQHNKETGCLMEYTGPNEEVNNFVNQVQTPSAVWRT